MSDPERHGTRWACASGMPDAGQLNALETLNIRGERSVTCKGAFDAHPSTGPLPPARRRRARRFASSPTRWSAPPSSMRSTARNPDLRRMPMYCVITAVQGSLRHQGHADDGEQRRRTSRWMCRRSIRPSSRGCARRARSSTRNRWRTNSTAARATPAARPRRSGNQVPGGQQMSAWSGQACNPYDTERVPRGSSGGSGVGVAANLATVGICEQSGASCQGPASRNGIALLLTTKGVHARQRRHRQPVVHRPRRHSRPHARRRGAVLDAIKDPAHGLLRLRATRSPPCPKALIPEPAVRQLRGRRRRARKNAKPLQGMRIAILREHMVKRTPNHEAITDQIDSEIKTVLRDRLGAELVEIDHARLSRRSRRAEPELHVSPTRCRSCCRG